MQSVLNDEMPQKRSLPVESMFDLQFDDGFNNWWSFSLYKQTYLASFYWKLLNKQSLDMIAYFLEDDRE